MLEALEPTSENEGLSSEDEEHENVNEMTPEEILEQRRSAVEEFGWEKFPETFNDMKKIGVHETRSENVDGLVRSGPSSEKLDTGSHLGKGPGFYVTPVGKKKLSTVTKDVDYGGQFVAIYVSKELKAIRSMSPEDDNTEILDRNHGEDKPCYYIMSGGGEIVIPVRYFRYVRVVSLASLASQLA